jgi:hypothetical protein
MLDLARLTIRGVQSDAVACEKEKGCVRAIVRKTARRTMSTTAQTRTTQFANMEHSQDRYATLPVRPMLLFIVALIGLSLFVIASKRRGRRAAVTTTLGLMSDRWLAEYRASHGS